MKEKITSLFQKVILIILMFILLFSIYSKCILKNNLIKIANISILVVLTGSMEPEIFPGEMIIIKENDNYKVNDIVTYKDENIYVTHRIVEYIDDEHIITKGDNNNIVDKDIFKEQIEGKVIYHSKIFGFFILFLLKPITIIYIISFTILFIINFCKKGENIEKK